MPSANNSGQYLAEVNESHKERLFHSDFRLYFFGSVNRADLGSRFGIKETAASRVFSLHNLFLYKALAPKNIEYDTRARTYVQREGFAPLFKYTDSQTLTALLDGFGDAFVRQEKPIVTCEAPSELNHPRTGTLVKVAQSIYQEKALQIRFRSLSSGTATREIVPFALVDKGLRWHVHTFDRLHGQFGDFVLKRIGKPKLLHHSAVSPSETKEADIQWNRIVEMHLVPHPRLQHRETIEYEYGMQNGMLKVNVRAAVAGYVLQRWNVDCTEDRSLEGLEYHLWLKNRQALYVVENLAVAPGYEPIT